MGELSGKVAIVTGAGRGIGRAQALAFAREGASVVVNDVGGMLNGEGSDGSPADEVVAEILAAGGKAVADGTDVSDWNGVEGLVKTAVSAFGGLDIVLNNAAVGRFGDIATISREDWERTVAVNLNGTAALCHWAAALWRREGPKPGRRIVNTSSGVGLMPVPGNPMYVASKAGIAALTVACAIELAELGVRANALAPVARTRMSKAAVGSRMDEVNPHFDPFAPEHTAAVAVYLASPSCSLTGRVVGIAGDSVTLFDGWSVAEGAGNGAKDWTVDAVRNAVSAMSPRQRLRNQGISEVKDVVMPSDAVLEALEAVER